MNLSNYETIKGAWEDIKSFISQWSNSEEKSQLMAFVNEAVKLEDAENYKIEMEKIYNRFIDIYSQCLVTSSVILDNLSKIRSSLDLI